MSDKLENLNNQVINALESTRSLFKDQFGVRLTYFARHPGRPELDVVITDDDLDEAAKALQQRAKRGSEGPKT